MTRSILFAALAGATLMAGCGETPGVGNQAADRAGEGVAENMTVEDVPPDGLSAPADGPAESESNGVGSASGGNAT